MRTRLSRWVYIYIYIYIYVCHASAHALRMRKIIIIIITCTCNGFPGIPRRFGMQLPLVAVVCARHLRRQSAFSSLTPLQLGVCVKGGCEAIIHAASHLMSSSSINLRWTLLLDFNNAFNRINREAMFGEFRRRIPSLSAWMESCYAGQPFLLLGTDSIRSCCGVQQGDPLGPLGFALTLHPLIEKIKAEVPGLS